MKSIKSFGPSARAILWPLALVCLVTAYGCPGPVNPDETEEGQMRNLVYDLPRHAETPDDFKTRFVEGSLPPESEWDNYKKFGLLIPDGGVDFVSDTEVTVKVELGHPETGEVYETKEWKLTKVGEEWLFSSAPLPPVRN